MSFDAESLASKLDHRPLKGRFGQSASAASIQISLWSLRDGNIPT